MKLNWVSILIIFLLVTNIGMVSTFLVKQKQMKETYENKAPEIHPKHARKQAFDKFLNEDLGLSEQQLKEFKEAQGEYFGHNNRLRQEIKMLEEQLMFEMAQENADTNKLNQITNRIGKLTEERKHIFYRHYHEVKSICDPQQMSKLDSLMHTLSGNDREGNRQRPGEHMPRR